MYTKTGAHPYPGARALHKKEIKPIVEEYAQAAINAIEAGDQPSPLIRQQSEPVQKHIKLGESVLLAHANETVKHGIHIADEV